MAFYQAIGKAQTPALCQFCGESPDIKWKCINCELFLCQVCCSKIHSKIKASMEHEIINLKDFEMEDFVTSIRKVDLENTVCTIHGKQKCFVFCKDCSQPACSKCLKETHKLHDYEALDEVYNDIICEMKKVMKEIQSKLQVFRNEKEKLQKILLDEDNNFQETRNIILQTEIKMKDDISKHTKDLLQELETKWKPSENLIKKELSAMKKSEEELETRKRNLSRTLQSHQVADIFSTNKTLDKSLPKCSVQKFKLNKTKFIPTNMTVNKGSQTIGNLYTVPDLKVIDTYESDVDNVTNILFCNDNTAFIGQYYSGKVQKVKFLNHNIEVEKEIQITVNDMAKTLGGEILLSCQDMNLKLYTKDGHLKKFKTFSPLKTLCVHMTKENKIIVGLSESDPVSLPASKDSTRKLLIMNQDGDLQHSIEHDKDNERLLNYPCRIETLNNKIIVIDVINRKCKGQVKMLDNGGQLHWTYNGCKSLNYAQFQFYPRDVAITSNDMILVSDCTNHAMHILNPAGEIVVCKDLASLGIELPLSLHIDKKVLWIGCNTLRRDKRKKAKINCVKLTLT